MANVYRPRTFAHMRFMSNSCKAGYTSVAGRYWQCSHKIWKDGWCMEHHPETEAARRAQSEQRRQERYNRTPAGQLVKAREEIARLKAERDETARVTRLVRRIYASRRDEALRQKEE